MDFELITKQVCELSLEVGEFLKKEIHNIAPNDIEEKGKHDFVTYVDKTSEKKIVEKLSKILPEAGFITEENTTSIKGKRFQWIIDPLDGTTNYINSIPLYSTSIALLDREEIVAGVINEVNLNECFYAWKNSPAFLNESEIKVTKTNSLNNALLATGFPYYDYSRLNEYLELFKYLIENTAGIRRLGSAAVDMAWVACGRFDGFYEYGLSPWDVAAGTIIVNQAGGENSDFAGENNFIFGKEIISTNSKIHKDFNKLLLEFFV
ncbi:MAG: inositol monophosphatase [Bacteroidales bacterium]|nr:inositol monophosphatase [Bacteroidales bacterium]